MNSSNRFLIALVATAVTFGSLYAFTGRPPGFDHRGYPHDREGCGEWSHKKFGNPAERPTRDQAPPNPTPTENQ